MQTLDAMQLRRSIRKFRPEPIPAAYLKEIVEISRKIDTFETSILPYEDCCTVFTPRHPSTKPKIEKVIASQNLLDCERLIQEAVDGTEIVVC